MIAAVILAGGQKNGLVHDQEKTTVNEALIKIGSRYMIEYVVEALRDSPYIKEIVVAGITDKLKQIFADNPDVAIVQCGETVIESFKNAVKAINTDSKKILIVTADIPLITKEAVNFFLESSFQSSDDLYYPIVRKEINDQKYPGVQRTYANLKEGAFTGGNLFILDPVIIERSLPVAEKLVQYRKKPIRLASYIGWGILIRYLLGMLSIEEAEKAVSDMMGIKGKVVISPYPEIGIDVDKESDLELARKLLCS